MRAIDWVMLAFIAVMLLAMPIGNLIRLVLL
jgi:hypothetical protein